MINNNKPICSMLMRIGRRFPGLLDDAEGDDRVLTAQYTCVKTATPIGPDNDIASPETCNSVRTCYKED